MSRLLGWVFWRLTVVANISLDPSVTSCNGCQKKNSGSVSLFSRNTYKDLKVGLQGCKGKASINMRREITFLAVLEASGKLRSFLERLTCLIVA